MQGTVLRRRGGNRAEKACNDYPLAPSLFSTLHVPAEPLGRHGCRYQAPSPKGTVCSASTGAGLEPSAAHTTPTMAASLSPAGPWHTAAKAPGLLGGKSWG